MNTRPSDWVGIVAIFLIAGSGVAVQWSLIPADSVINVVAQVVGGGCLLVDGWLHRNLRAWYYTLGIILLGMVFLGFAAADFLHWY